MTGEEVVIEVWPKRITQWRCPHCGAVLNLRSYTVDPKRKKCSKTIHKDLARPRDYVLAEDGKSQVGY